MLSLDSRSQRMMPQNWPRALRVSQATMALAPRLGRR